MTERSTDLLRKLVPGRGLLVLLVVLAVAGGIFLAVRDTTTTTITALFPSAEGLHVGDDVKVIGVRVGEITDVENVDDGVLVTMEVDGSQPIPADASAALVSPSLVSGRFIQLEPVYSGGDRMADGDRIGIERTAVPVTFDEVKQQLTDLSTTLGPGNGDQPAPLATAIRSLERGLRKGNSHALRTSITELRGAAAALSDGRSDLFSTIDNLDRFTSNLALNDAAVRGFTTELDDVSGMLAENRQALTGALRGLGRALAATEGYLKRHRGRITRAAEQLTVLGATLADRSNELAGILHVAPHSLMGLHNTIENQAITARAALANLDSLSTLVCGTLLGTTGNSAECTEALQPLLEMLGLDQVGSDLLGGAR